jgi:hypothetical protein
LHFLASISGRFGAFLNLKMAIPEIPAIPDVFVVLLILAVRRGPSVELGFGGRLCQPKPSNTATVCHGG